MRNNEINLTITKLKENLNILVLSDLHLTKNSSSKNVDVLLRNLKKSDQRFDYICIAGDLVNDSSYLNNYEFACSIVYLMSELEKLLTPNGKIIISIGNHDFMFLDGKWRYDKNSSLKNFISYYTNATLLDNESLKDEKRNLILYGLTNSFGLYEHYNENPEIFSEELNELMKKDFYGNEFAKMLIAHPARLILEKSTNFDLVVGGHYHNGCVPNFLVNAPGTRGIFHPQDPITKPSFPNNVRGTFELDGKYVVLNGAINPFNDHQFLNNLYGGYSTTLKLNK